MNENENDNQTESKHSSVYTVFAARDLHSLVKFVNEACYESDWIPCGGAFYDPSTDFYYQAAYRTPLSARQAAAGHDRSFVDSKFVLLNIKKIKPESPGFYPTTGKKK
jgi:hypothetical protein